MEFTLRKWREGDAESVAKYANNPKIEANLRDGFPSPYTLEDAKAYVKSCLEDDEAESFQRVIEAAGEAVGNIGVFRGKNVYSKSAEVGYWLAEPFWGQGVMTEAIRQACREAFEKYDIVRLHAEPFAHNIGSRRALEKAGFTLEGVLRNSVYKHGEMLDSCVYALLKTEEN